METSVGISGSNIASCRKQLKFQFTEHLDYLTVHTSH